LQGFMNRAPNLVDNYAIRSKTKSIGVRQQILGYIGSVTNQSIDFDRTLYTIWTGTNNYPFNRSLTVADTVQSITQCADLLVEFGARNLILINEPPFDRFPQYQGKNNTNVTQQLFINHNALLAAKIKEKYPASTKSGNIRLFDSHSFVLKVIQNYTSYGFENLASCWDTITGSKIQVLCPDITKRMFCDEYHFTSKMQTLIAEELHRFLTFDSSDATRTAFAQTSVSLIIFYTFVFTNLFYMQ
jgi:thermolabile hemolysin